MITVVSPGARTLIEDSGRVGYEHLGVPTSGAADQHSLAVANALVGNTDNAAALEMALHGPTLTFACDAVIAYTGTDTDLRLDGRPVPTLHAVPVTAGQTLAIGTLRGGVYGYLAVRGGLDTDPVLGSRSSCTLSGLGPAPLSTGTVLRLGTSAREVPFRAAIPRPDLPTIRCLPGPHADLFTEQARRAFRSTSWAVSADSSRVGVRLEGASLPTPAGSVPSMGMVTGAVQVPPTGTPIVLGPDHGTTGGYPVVAVVIEADLPAFFQRAPGAPVRFSEVTVAEAASASTASPWSSILLLEAVAN